MMRFERMGHYEFEDTARKRAAYARKLRLELERYPLFADEIALEQTPVEVVMQGRTRQFAEQMVRDRARQAEKWRQARQRLRVIADVILTHPVGVNLTHLGNDGGLLATDNVDSGASSGDQGNGASWRQHPGDGQAVGLFTQHNQAIPA